jgi:methyl-accepting chemotaxis protein
VFSPFTNSDTANIMAAFDRSQAIIKFNMDGTIIDANKNFCDAMGYTLEEIKGKHHRIFAEPDFASSQEYANFWADLRAGKFQSAQYKRLAKGGRVVYIEATYNPVLDASGKPYMVVKFATDVTVKVTKMTEALDRQQAVISFNLDGTILEANENFLAAVGYSLPEIKGQHHRMFVDPAEATGKAYAEFWEALNRGEYQAGEFKRLGKGGREIWLRASYNPVYGNDGKLCRVTKYATDITEEKVGRVKRLGDLINTVATATEQLTTSVGDIARNIGTTRDAVGVVSQQTEAATDCVKQMASRIEGMGSVTTFIEKISGQINLLALNAAIEAARAGDAGRGFSVVADEVKKLARQVSESTGTISGEIGGIQKSASDVSASLRQITSLVSDLTHDATSVASATEEQSAATRDISKTMLTVRELLFNADGASAA